MPLFVVDDDDFNRLCKDPPALAEKADAYIRDLYKKLEIAKAQSEASSVTAEQTCSIIEQKYLSLSSDFADLQAHKTQLESTLDQRLSELAQIQAEKHQLHLQSIGKDGEIERLSTESSELHRSKRQLLELLEHKDLEISEKNSTIKSYLDKIVSLTDNAASREARISGVEAELTRTQAACTRFCQEKELIERHNTWLNDELSSKVKSLIELRKTHTELEAEMSEKLSNVERQFDESSSSLKRTSEKLRELEMKHSSLQEELCSSKNDASASENRFIAEISTVNKLVELYKESSEEWSNKALELEGVIKALETHLGQVENDYKQRLEEEVSARKEFEKESADLKEKFERCKSELESSRKENELNLVPVPSLNSEKWVGSFENGIPVNTHMNVPSVPVGVSGTALAASLLRDGWSLAKLYGKYQETVDALRHEQLGRKQAEGVLERVLHEIEEKARVILDERDEHERMLEAYSVLNEKLQYSCSEQTKLENIVQDLKADLRRLERDYTIAQKEVVGLQREVTILLKECQDIQVRCGSVGYKYAEDQALLPDAEIDESDVDRIISERLLTFKDISGLVEQNVHLRSLVRSLSDDIENRNLEVKQMIDLEVQKRSDEATSKVAAVLERSSEQARMIESLHNSVAMYKRLYEEEHKHQTSDIHAAQLAPGDGRSNILLPESSQEVKQKTEEQAAERIRYLEQDLSKSRSEILSIRLERDKLAMEATLTSEKLESFMKEFGHQRDEMNGVLARNVELSQLIVDCQRKMRENSDSLHTYEENSQKLTMEVSILKAEKELLSNSEKRACEEVHSLMERVHRLQASLDTVHVTEEVREEARCAEKSKREEYIKQIEREWAEAKKELQDERDSVRKLTLDREHTVKNAMRQVEEMGKELSNALHAVTAAEARAAVAEARVSDLEKRNKSEKDKAIDIGSESGPSSSLAQVNEELNILRDECEKLKLEARDKNDHMLQYKEIAEVNETALKGMECAHENFKTESEKVKQSLEGVIISLRQRVVELEDELSLKSKDAAFAVSGKEVALNVALAEVATLKEERSSQMSQIATMEIQISVLKENVEEQHQRWHTAQQNYERQVILQSETIQELTKTSKAFTLLHDESSELRKLVDAHRNECNEIKATWEREKAVHEKLKNEAERKYNDINEQNKILHGRLEALHIQLAKKDQNVAGISSQCTSSDSQGDLGLQDVINHLRRSKEMAETEVSVMKQEKLRLLSQLDSAVKAADTAQAALHAERANSRSSLLSEEGLNNLKRQVTEINLLRESNMQLREENKHNLEECQKLREAAHKSGVDFEKLEILMKEREAELEACKKEVELQRAGKDHLEKRITELLERFKNIDVEDYDRVKDKVQQMQASLKEKDVLIEEIKKIVSKKEDAVAHLEHEHQKSVSELAEREKRINDILQHEAGLKLDLEKQRKFVAQYKRKSETFSKEKDELSRENQTLSKQLEDLKQGKRSMTDAAGEQAMKEKEKEKDTRIQILEKTVEKTREDLRKEKSDHQKEKAKRQKTENTIENSYKNVTQEKKKLDDEFEKYKQDFKILSDELERLKDVKTSLPEGSSAAQHLADLGALPVAYASAVECFEKVALSIISKPGGGGLCADSPVVDSSTTATVSASSEARLMPCTSSTPSLSPTKQTEEKEKKLSQPRKTGRKLIRPRSFKPEEPQSDVEMSEIDGSNNGRKLGSSNATEIEGNPNLLNQPIVRKRVASAPVFELQEETPIRGDSSSDGMAPVLKKFRGSDSLQECPQELAAPSQNVGALPPAQSDNIGALISAEDLDATAADLPDVSIEEGIDAEKDDIQTSGGQSEEQKGPQQLVATNEVEMQSTKNEIEDVLEKPSEAEVPFDDGSTDIAGQDFLDSVVETGSDREGEVDMEDDADDVGRGTDVAEDQPDNVTALAFPDVVDDEAAVPATLDDVMSPNVLNDEKDEGDALEERAVIVGKSSHGTEQIAAEIGQGPEAASAVQEATSSMTAAEAGSLKQASPSSMSMPEKEDAKQSLAGGSSSRTINLRERARQQAQIRQGGRGVRGQAARRGGSGPASS